MRRVRRGRRRRLPRARVHDRRRRRDRPRGLLRQHLRHHRLHRAPGLQEDGRARHVLGRVRLHHVYLDLLRHDGLSLPVDRARVDPPHRPLRRPDDGHADARLGAFALLPGHHPGPDARRLRLHSGHVLRRHPDGHHLPRQRRFVQLARALLHLHLRHRPQLYRRLRLGLHRRRAVHGRHHARARDRGPDREAQPGLALRRRLRPAHPALRRPLAHAAQWHGGADHHRPIQPGPGDGGQAHGRVGHGRRRGGRRNRQGGGPEEGRALNQRPDGRL
mmetsp:Transcript_9690/g.33445  ORF Transcript_9690/g.33445 Transcript_9690/m.33445 type:complete len:275 (+) Transcript_9690:883-1707(+)